MRVNLLHYTPLSVAVIGARTCWDSFHKGGNYIHQTDNISDGDKALLKRLVSKLKHESIIEHISYNFRIQNIPRFVLQELARHRVASLSVKSSRYTLKELKDEEEFYDRYFPTVTDEMIRRAKKYISFNPNVSYHSQLQALENLRYAIAVENNSLDEAKYLLPENYKTDLVWSINVRSLRNFFNLRMNRQAHPKIQELSKQIYQQLPDTHLFLFEDVVTIS